MSQDWPVVAENDDGIRPAGLPDHCFYCHQRVGSPHAPDCVTVYKVVLYDVLVNDKKLGELVRHEPFSWDAARCEASRNGGSWCAMNAFDQATWQPGAKAKLNRALRAAGSTCGCGVLVFKFNRVTRPGPCRDLRPEEETCT